MMNINNLFAGGGEYMKLMAKGKRLLSVLGVMIFILSSQVSGASVAPLEQIRVTVDGILALMQDEGLGSPDQREERRGLMMALVDERFDFTEMSKRILGRNWKTRTSEERDEFQKLFSDLLKNNYIGRIEGYSDEKVEYAKEVFNKKKSDRARVYTKILKNGHEIPLNYSLIRKGEEWFVYDVIIEGVSLVRNYRTEFGRILKKEKFPGLVKRIHEKIELNEAKRKK